MEGAVSQVQRFATEYDPGGEQYQRHVDTGIDCRLNAVHPGNKRLVKLNELTNIKPLQMWNHKVYDLHQALDRFGPLHRKLPQVFSQQKDSDDDHERNGGV